MSDPSLSYLVHRVAARIETSANRRTKPYGLRLQGFRVMHRLWEKDGQSLGELSAVTSIEASTLSHLVNRMVNDGWLAKARLESDDRSIVITLSPAGRQLAARLVPMLEQYETVCLNGFTTGEKETVKRALLRIFENLEGLDAFIDAWEQARPRDAKAKIGDEHGWPARQR